MASSLLTTDRRWAAPTRKSGMTVLGKVPKPINLPSQRLENNGLDPNLEIVPKGTLTWGSKQPTTPNAWGSSSILATKNDGAPGSSSNLNGRPSSGGGSRPSTAGSESLGSPNAWGPNSRPSSASGMFPSPHLPMATNRPRSAETRPGSSQLSRFADNASENVKASIRTIDRPGSSSHGHGFTLSTGDFPTLGSEVNSQRGHSSKGRPTSSSGKEASQAEQVKSHATGTGEAISPSNNQPIDIMKTEQHAHAGGAPVPTTSLPNEGLQPQPYPPNFRMPPPQFDSWRAPPGHPPEGVWHRGPAPGGPYRPVGTPGSFPVEPFGYYGQFPPNSEAAARSGHGGYQPKNGDAYHPMPPNSYIMNQPVISVRPVYQGPVTYDGYYGPRANFNNANVRDPHFVGGPHQPGILNQFPIQNDKFHPGHSHSRSGKHETVPREQLESDKVHVFRRGQPGSLHDNPDRLGGTHEFERNGQPAPPLLPHPGVNRTDVSMRTDVKDTFSERNRVLTKSIPDQRGLVGTDHLSAFETAHSHARETGDGTLRKKFKEDNSVTLDRQPVIRKNAALIEKIESLNNKARNVDARSVPEPASSKEFKKQQKGTDSKADQVVKDVSSTAVISGIACVSDRLSAVPADGTIEAVYSQLTEFNKAEKLGDSINDRANRKGDSRNSHQGSSKDRPPNKFASHARGESSAADSLPAVDQRNHNQHDSESASQLQQVTVPDDMSTSVDYESQRAKMKELAAERAKKLKAEEEERIKNQKAKALAKLEELNRRSSALQKKSNDTKVETDDARDKQKAGVDVTTKLATSTAEPRDVTAHDSLTALQPPNDSKDTVVHVQSTAQSHASSFAREHAAHAPSSSAMNTQSNMEHIDPKSISQSHDISVPKPRQGYRKRHVVSEEKVPVEKPSVPMTTGNAKKNIEVSVDTSMAVVTSHDDPPAQNKKGSRHLRSKKKVDDAPVISKPPPMVSNEQNSVKVSNEPKTHTGGVIISSSIVPTEGAIVTVGSITVGGISLAPLNQERVKSPDGTHNTENSRSRPQLARKPGKHQPALRPVEKPHGSESVLWAPVNPPGQNVESDGAMPKTAVADRCQPAGKNYNDGENVTRTKRAEMERYVPKPLSKELQHQYPTHDNEATDKSGADKLDAATEPKKPEDKKTSKGHGKSHPSWRRRNTDESASVVPNPVGQAENSHGSMEVQNSTNQNQPVELDKKEDLQLKSKADTGAENSSATAQTVPLPISGAKEHSAANRQRRQHAKAQRNEANSLSNVSKDREGRNDFVYQSATLSMDSNSSDHRNMPRPDVKSSGVVSHSRTHWKPKSNSHSQNSADGNVAVDGPVESHGGRLEMNSSKGSDSTTRQGSSGKHITGDGTDEKDAQSEHENLTRDTSSSQKIETHSSAEQQQVNPPPRRQGQHNTRYHRGGGTHRGRGGYDAGRPSHGTNAERRRGGSHLEYQPVGSHNKASDFQQNPSVEERTDGLLASGPAFRGRGHNRGPRPAGHFVRRNPPSASAANSYQDE